MTFVRFSTTAFWFPGQSVRFADQYAQMASSNSIPPESGPMCCEEKGVRVGLSLTPVERPPSAHVCKQPPETGHLVPEERDVLDGVEDEALYRRPQPVQVARGHKPYGCARTASAELPPFTRVVGIRHHRPRRAGFEYWPLGVILCPRAARGWCRCNHCKVWAFRHEAGRRRCLVCREVVPDPRIGTAIAWRALGTTSRQK